MEDELAAAHRGDQPVAVQDVPDHRLGAGAADPGRRLRAAHQGAHLEAGADQPLEDGTSDEATGPGDEDRSAHSGVAGAELRSVEAAQRET